MTGLGFSSLHSPCLQNTDDELGITTSFELFTRHQVPGFLPWIFSNKIENGHAGCSPICRKSISLTPVSAKEPTTSSRATKLATRMEDCFTRSFSKTRVFFSIRFVRILWRCTTKPEIFYLLFRIELLEFNRFRDRSRRKARLIWPLFTVLAKAPYGEVIVVPKVGRISRLYYGRVARRGQSGRAMASIHQTCPGRNSQRKAFTLQFYSVFPGGWHRKREAQPRLRSLSSLSAALFVR